MIDLFLPDSSGIETLEKLIQAAPLAPILVLTGVEDERIAAQVARLGALD